MCDKLYPYSKMQNLFHTLEMVSLFDFCSSTPLKFFSVSLRKIIAVQTQRDLGSNDYGWHMFKVSNKWNIYPIILYTSTNSLSHSLLYLSPSIRLRMHTAVKLAVVASHLRKHWTPILLSMWPVALMVVPCLLILALWRAMSDSSIGLACFGRSTMQSLTSGLKTGRSEWC